MISYKLRCELSHTFEGWFRNSGDFERQCEMKLVSCPVCGSEDIQKTLMAPAVATSRSKEGRAANIAEEQSETSVPSPTPAAPAGAPVQGQSKGPQSALMSLNDEQRQILDDLKTLREKMTSGSDYVGKEFASEARKIHYGETTERNIYGETTKEDAEALLEEGIAILPLPQLPEEKN
ncbi:MAG: DUF1178 family protein [Rhodobacteraceae bacterium]|nr:DUF1178 family protein [Paracoccaceae bacterium]